MNKFGYLKAYKVKVLPIKYLITKGEITHQDNEKETSLDEQLDEIYQQTKAEVKNGTNESYRQYK